MKFIRFLQVVSILLFVTLFLIFYIEIKNDNKNNNEELVLAEIEEGAIEEVAEEKPLVEQKYMPNTEETEQREEPRKQEKKKTVITKFYYKQLDEYSKLIYETLEENKDSFKNGNTKITLPKDIANAIENDNEIETIFSVAINAFECDNPDIFYFDATKMVLYYERSSLGNYNIYLKNSETSNNYLIDGLNGREDVDNGQKEIESIVAEIESNVRRQNNDYNKVLYIHDWLCKNVKYDETLSRTNKDSIYGVFVEREAVCGGYAKAFKYLLDRANINCIVVQGIGTAQGTENHAWNYVELDNNWYAVDVTWDDPVIIGDLSNYREQDYYTYFLKGTNTFNIDHEPFETFYASNLKIEYPELSEYDYGRF